MYLSWVKSAVPVPRWTLVGFQRVTVSLDTPQQLSFTVTARQMAVWIDDKTGFSVQTGMHRFSAIFRNMTLITKYPYYLILLFIRSSGSVSNMEINSVSH